MRYYRDYSELIFLSISFILFYTIAMNFMLALSKTNFQLYDCVLNIIENFSRKVLLTVKRSIFNVSKYVSKILDRL